MKRIFSQVGKVPIVPLSRPITVPLTQAELEWLRISQNLDRWNKEHAREAERERYGTAEELEAERFGA